MKIAMISSANSIHTVRWANALALRGHAVTLFSQADQRDTGLLSQQIRLFYLPYTGKTGYVRNARVLRREITLRAPDIIHVHYASGYGSLARHARIPADLLSVWGSDVYDFPRKSPVHKRILCKNLMWAEYLASTSEAMALQTRTLVTPRHEIAITPFGVELERFCLPRHSGGPFTFGIIKTLEPKYGVEYLIRAYAIFRAQTPGEAARLLIYGRGREQKKLESLCRELGVGEEAAFMGYVENQKVPEALAQMDVFCLSSVLDSESFGVAAVEAMAASLPVVATDTDGFCEVMEDGVTGFLVPRKDPEAMARKMLQLYWEPQTRQRMGEKGKERVRERYQWSDNVTEMERLYQRILAAKRKEWTAN